MRRLRRLLLWTPVLMVLALVAWLGYRARESMGETPRQAYVQGLRVAFGPDRDPDSAFREFDFALRGALAEKDRELAVDVLRSRARLYTGMGSLNRARRDYEELLAHYRPDDLESQLGLIRLLLRQEEDDEALRRIGQVLKGHPGNASALASRGQLLVRRADEQLRLAQELIDAILPASLRGRAGTALRQVAAMPTGDPRRARLESGVREISPAGNERQVQTLFDRADQAGRELRQAREALIQSFRGQPQGETLVTFLDLAAQTSREDAIDFALGTARMPTAAAQPAFLQRTLQLLRGNGQPHLAAEALGILLADNVGGPAVYATWCRLLYEQERWTDLASVAIALFSAGDRDQRSSARAYMGLAYARLGKWDLAQVALQRYLRPKAAQPFPDALPTCWAALAECYREQGQDENEIDCLRRALGSSVGSWSGPALDGELWLRLAELADAEPPGRRTPNELERALTYAICRLPERAGEILPLWEDVGRRNLDAANIDLQLVLEEMLLDASYSTPATATPYEIFELARMLAGRKKQVAALRACTRLLHDFPGFLPAVDLALQTREEMDQQTEVADLLMQRLQLLPGDPATLRQLEELSAVALSPDQILPLVRADPAGAGRRRMLDALEREGLQGVAAAGLLSLPEDSLRAEDQIEAARLLLALGEPGEIEVALDLLPSDPAAQAQALALRLSAAVELGDWDRFDTLLGDLEGTEALDGRGLEGLLDPLLVRSPARAVTLASYLDETGRWRSGALLLALSQARDLDGDRVAAHTELERADAFLGDGAPELGYVFETARAHDWGHLPGRIADARRSLDSTPLVDVLLDGMGERLDAAATALAAKVDSQTAMREPLWVLVDAAVATLRSKAPRKVLPGWTDDLATVTASEVRSDDRDPRDMLALVLALQHPRWRAWAVARALELSDPEDPAARLWPAYIAARGLLALGEFERSETLTQALTERWPEFRPGWDLLERAYRRVHERAAGGPGRVPRAQPDTISWVRWRERELIGLPPAEAADEHWMSALEADRQGDLRMAQRRLGRALELRPDDVRYRLTQVHLYVEDKDWQAALVVMGHTLDSVAASSDSVVAERAVALRRAAQASPEHAALAKTLADLRDQVAARFPEDPLVALDLARGDIAAASAGVDIGLTRALNRLDAFRTFTKGAPLNSLRKGAARAWFDFLLPFDPSLAYFLAMRELSATPGDVELWRMLAEANEARGNVTEAIAIYGMLQRALAFPQDARELVRLEAQRGADRDAFEDAFAAVLAQEGLDEPDPDLLYQRGVFLLNSGPFGWDLAVETFARLWWKLKPQPAKPAGEDDRSATPGGERADGGSGEGEQAGQGEQGETAGGETEPATSGDGEPTTAEDQSAGSEPDQGAEAGGSGEPAPVDASQEDLAARPDDTAPRRLSGAELRTLRKTYLAVSKAYALALLWRGAPEDERKAVKLLDEVLAGTRGRADTWVLRGLREVAAGRMQRRMAQEQGQQGER